jgi:hypothetical protein
MTAAGGVQLRTGSGEWNFNRCDLSGGELRMRTPGRDQLALSTSDDQADGDRIDVREEDRDRLVSE